MLLYPCHHLLVMLHILLTHHPQYWTLGQHMEYLCKLIGTTQATCVFFSGFSILLIAVDRFMFIVHPAATQISTKQVREHQGRSGIQSFVTQAFILSCVTLFISTFLSSPLFFLTKLDVKETLMDETYSYCYEVRPHYQVQSLTSKHQNWDPPHSRIIYTLLCFLLQYLIPSVVVGIVYTKYVISHGLTLNRKEKRIIS